jgi:MFS family permease
MYNIGSILSFFVVPYVADAFGRRITIVIGCIIMIGGAVLSAFCNGYNSESLQWRRLERHELTRASSSVHRRSPRPWLWQLLLPDGQPHAFDRNLSPPAPWSAHHRLQLSVALWLSQYVSIAFQQFIVAWEKLTWHLVVSVVGWGTSSINNDWSWRSITLIQAVPSLAQLIGIWWIPESPRWLMSKDRPEKALAVLAKYHGGGDVHNATVQFQYREIKETILHDRSSKKSSRYIDFLLTSGNRWRLAIIMSLGVISQYSGNALFSNYIDAIYEGAGITEENQKLAVSVDMFAPRRAFY